MSEIKRSVERHGNILPAAVNAISALPEEFLRHDEHQIRHPLSAYLTSLRLIGESWNAAHHEIAAFKDGFLSGRIGVDAGAEKILPAYANLLHRMHEHFDACYVVLRSMAPPRQGKKIAIDSQFLNVCGLPGWKSFQESVKYYKDRHVGLASNILKHRQGELRLIVFSSGKDVRPGYFVLDRIGGGALGPSKEMHGPGREAFSFSRDMLVHFWRLYQIGDSLASAVSAAYKALAGRDLRITAVQQQQPQLAIAMEKAAMLDYNFFPDEVGFPTPRVVVSPNARLSIKMPGGKRTYWPRNEFSIKTSIVMDASYRSFQLPYLKHSARQS